ncbi:MAG: hypothetical protein U5R31_00655 [Acidimicrobiia bacterium]|nr:hypothetical protein [Acidimicrobiia bacterium]
MDRFAELTGRRYRLFDYVGHPEAERVVVDDGLGRRVRRTRSSTTSSPSGEKVGLVEGAAATGRSRSTASLAGAAGDGAVGRGARPHQGARARPASRCSSTSTAALVDAAGPRGQRDAAADHRRPLRAVVARSSTRRWSRRVFDELAADSPGARFTVGINDDVDPPVAAGRRRRSTPNPTGCGRAVFFGLGSDGTVSSNKAAIKIIGETTDRCRARATSSTTRRSPAR